MSLCLRFPFVAFSAHILFFIETQKQKPHFHVDIVRLMDLEFE